MTKVVSKTLNQDKKRQNTVSITQSIIDFLKREFPMPHNAQSVVKSIGCKKTTASRILNRLSQNKESPIEKYDRGFFISKITPENLGNFERPEIKLHNLKLHFVPIETKKPDSPHPLYIPKTSQISKTRYWNHDRYPYKVTFQFNPTSTITVHLNASKKPLNQLDLRDFYTWLNGVFSGLEIPFIQFELKIVLFELNKDYRKVTVTPTMVEIRELMDESWLRIYRKYTNLTRLECSTTFEGDKEIYRLFIEFGQPTKNSSKKDEFIDVV